MFSPDFLHLWHPFNDLLFHAWSRTIHHQKSAVRRACKQKQTVHSFQGVASIVYLATYSLGLVKACTSVHMCSGLFLPMGRHVFVSCRLQMLFGRLIVTIAEYKYEVA